MDDASFVSGVVCDRCRGPILAEPYHKVIFEEDSLDYVNQTIWACYYCGKEHTLDSQPYYAL